MKTPPTTRPRAGLGRALTVLSVTALWGVLAATASAFDGVTVYYVRHAESFANAKERYIAEGREAELPEDLDALSPVGEQQAQALVAKLEPYAFDHILVSPLNRARATILPYAQQAGLRAEIWPELAEARAPRSSMPPAWGTAPIPPRAGATFPGLRTTPWPSPIGSSTC